MKKIITLLASLALVASGLHILPAAAAEEAPVVPEVVNIEDPANDANYLNNQGLPAEVPGDNVTPADVSTLGDILKVWFTNDADNANLHIQTQAAVAEGGNNAAIFFRVQVDPDGAGEPCLWFQAGTTGTNNLAGAVANLRSVCGGGDEVLGDGELTVATGPEDTGIYTISVPRSLHASLGEGGKLLAPIATSRNYWNATVQSATAPQIDDTLPGTDYLMVDGEASDPSAGKTPPGKNDPPGKKKGCKKGKGKKRGCEGKGKKSPKRGKPVAECAPLEPADAGVGAETIEITDAHTAEAPLVQPIELEQRFDEGLTSEAVPTSVNVQVDSELAEAGLYATLEFPARRDYDLWAYFPASPNEEAASSHGFNPLIETQGLPGDADQSNTATNHGGETTASSENLVGILTPDCGGYTITAYNYFGEGGELELKLWLGDVAYDPAETASEEGAARSIYNSMLAFI